MKPVSQQRLIYLDVLRAAAIIAVIVIHASDQILRFSNQYLSPSWLFAAGANASMRWAVPIFIMISGALLLNKQESIKQIWKSRIPKLLIPYFFWGMLYLVWNTQYNPDSLGFFDMFSQLVVNVSPYYHLYFLLALAGIYALLPILKQVASNRSILLYAIFLFAAMSMAYNFFASYMWMIGPRSYLSSVYMWLPYVAFFLLGSVLRDESFDKIKTWHLLLAYSLSTAVTFFGYYIMHVYFGHSSRGVLFEQVITPQIFISSMALFIVAKRYVHPANSLLQKVVKALSKHSYGMYLIHLFVLEALSSKLMFSSQTIAGNLQLIVVTTVVSFACSMLLANIPFLKRTVGH